MVGGRSGFLLEALGQLGFGPGVIWGHQSRVFWGSLVPLYFQGGWGEGGGGHKPQKRLLSESVSQYWLTRNDAHNPKLHILP